MRAKKKTVSSPLHLLQQLSHSLVEHLEKACSDARKEADGVLAKLEKQRSKTRDKLVQARSKLDDAGAAGKARAQSKARARIDELEDAVALLDARQRETLGYLAELSRDTQQSLKLAEGIRRVEEAAAQATAPATAVPAPSGTRQRSGTGSTRKTVKPAPVVEAAPATPARKSRPSRGASSKAKSAEATAVPASEAKPAAAKAPAPRKPAARKPAARKPAGTTQAPGSSS